MKSITRLSLTLIMFSLFSISYLVTSVSADMYNPPPNPSNDPRNILKSESVDLNKQTLQFHKRIAELEGVLLEANVKISDLEHKLCDATTARYVNELKCEVKTSGAPCGGQFSTKCKASEHTCKWNGMRQRCARTSDGKECTPFVNGQGTECNSDESSGRF
jgi:hypothetical protein